MYSVLVAAMALHAGVHNLDNSSGIVDLLLPGQIADTVWTVSCDGTFVVQYLNDFGGEFIISIDGKEESRVSGEDTTLTRKSFSANTTVSMTASVKSHGNKKVLFSWACDAVPAALPSTLNTAGDVSHMKYGPSELVYWTLQCKEHEEVHITWTSFNIGNDSLWMRARPTFFNATGLDTVEDFTFTSTGSTYVFFKSEAGSVGGDFAFRYECLSNDIALPSSGIVDRLLPAKIADTVWTVSCRGIFVVQYLNDFGGDFIISIDGNENLRVSGEDSRVTKLYFPTHATASMTASVKTGNKKVLFSWACDAMPAALPSTLNTAGDVSHMKYGPNELVYWVLQCKEHEEVNITWTSFDIGNDSLWMVQRESGVWTTFFNASGLDTVEDFTFTSAGSTFVVFTSEAGSDGGDFAFRYECLSTPAPPTAEPPATPTGAPTALPTADLDTKGAFASTDSDDGGLSVGAIIGISVGVGLVAIAAVVLVVCYVARKQTTRAPKSPNAFNEYSKAYPCAQGKELPGSYGEQSVV